MSALERVKLPPALVALRTLTARHKPIKTADVHPHDGVNKAIAGWVTDKVGSMWAAYAFCLLALVSLPAALASHDPIVIVAWIAQTFLQLVLLPVILVGQSVQSAHADARAEQDFQVNQRSLAEIDHLLTIIQAIDERTLALVQATPQGSQGKLLDTGSRIDIGQLARESDGTGDAASSMSPPVTPGA